MDAGEGGNHVVLKDHDRIQIRGAERDSQIVPNQQQWMLAKGGTMLSLKTMTESKLEVLKREVEAAIHAKVIARRQEIESELSKLSLLDGGGRAKIVRAAAKRTGAVKYRNTAPARKVAGRKLDESLIAGGAKLSTSAKQPKKTRKPRTAPNAANMTQAVPLISAKIDHTEPLPIDALAATSFHSNNIPGDVGSDAVAAVAP
jgi:hypothetical protein